MILLFSNKLVILSQDKINDYKEGSLTHINVHFEGVKDFLKGTLLNKRFLILNTIVIYCS